MEGYPAFWAMEGLFVIADAIKAVRKDDYLLVNEVVGDEFVCPAFELRSHCACDRTIHPVECPPNFVYHGKTDFIIRWGRFAGQETISNKPKPEGMLWELAVAYCIRAVAEAAA